MDYLERLWAENPTTVAVLGALLVLILAILSALVRARRRSRDLMAALGDSARGQVVLLQPMGLWGFEAAIQPAPEPFRHFVVRYRAAPALLTWLLRPILPGANQLTFQASLNTRPAGELLWIRGQVPSRALGKGTELGLWVQHRLDISGSEYATRGPNPGALQHVFLDLQTRFGPILRKVSIQADTTPEMEVVVRTRGLNPEQIPALVATLRAAGRAALY